MAHLQQNTAPGEATSAGDKVGSSDAAAKAVGGKGDFGIPVHPDIVRETEGEIVGRPAGSAPGYSGAKGVRTTGVGSLGGEPGHDSGGDIDTDYDGFGTPGGLSAKPVDESTLNLTGADVVDGSSDPFASGKPAAGRNAGIKGSHGASPRFKGDTVDHSGTDASTVSPNSGGTVTAARGEVPGPRARSTWKRRPATSTKGPTSKYRRNLGPPHFDSRFGMCWPDQ